MNPAFCLHFHLIDMERLKSHIFISLFTLVLVSPGQPSQAGLVERFNALLCGQVLRETALKSARKTQDELKKIRPVDITKASPIHEFKKEKTVEELVKEGLKLHSESWKELGIPKSAWEYYDLKTGKFNYKLDQPRLLALENGDVPLTAIRMNYSDESSEISDDLLREYIELLKISLALELWIIVNHDHGQKLQAHLLHLPDTLMKRIKIASVGSKSNVLLWAQDPAKPLASGHRSLLPRLYLDSMEAGVDHAAYYRDSEWALDAAGLSKVERSLFRFEGGNIIVGAQHIFVGSDIIDVNARDLRISRHEAKRVLSIEFGKEVLEVGAPLDTSGGLAQIDFHIDLSMAVVRNKKTNRETVLLGSPSKAIEILSSNISIIQKKQTPLFYKTGEASNEYKRMSENQILAQLKKSDSYYREAWVKYMTKKLQRIGYEVALVPGLYMQNMGRDDLEYYNYTNLIVDTEKILMPNLGIDSLDKYSRKVYEDLGYEVIGMDSSRFTLCLSGGIRCTGETFR
jgi:hypothetical protein